MGPSSTIRIKHNVYSVHRYVRILQLAAHESEAEVDGCLRRLIDSEESEERISTDQVKERFVSGQQLDVVTDVRIDAVCLQNYDQLLPGMEVSG